MQAAESVWLSSRGGAGALAKRHLLITHLCFPSSDIWLTVRSHELRKAEVLTSVLLLQEIVLQRARREARSGSRTSEAPAQPCALRPGSGCELRSGNQAPIIYHFHHHKFPSRTPGLCLGLSTDAARAASTPGICFQTAEPCLH